MISDQPFIFFQNISSILTWTCSLVRWYPASSILACIFSYAGVFFLREDIISWISSSAHIWMRVLISSALQLDDLLLAMVIIGMWKNPPKSNTWLVDHVIGPICMGSTHCNFIFSRYFPQNYFGWWFQFLYCNLLVWFVCYALQGNVHILEDINFNQMYLVFYVGWGKMNSPLCITWIAPYHVSEAKLFHFVRSPYSK